MVTFEWYRNFSNTTGWAALPEKTLWDNVGVFQPLLVDTQDEVDYFTSMKIMKSEDFIVLLKDRDENPTDLPVSHIRVLGL